MKKSLMSILGNALSVVGVTLTPQELESVEHITAIICMVIGLLITIVSSIIIPLIKWWKNAKADGKITNDELNEGANIIANGVSNLKDKIEDKEENK